MDLPETESHPAAAAILRAAGWKPHDGWNVYTRDTLVMGFQPDGQAFHVKNWAAITEGHPQWTADTPDTAEEAAAWLVERFKPAPVFEVPPDAITYTLAEPQEEVETPHHESDSETGEEAESGSAAGHAGAEGGVREGAASDEGGENYAPPREALESEPLDADFDIADLGTESEELSEPTLEGSDLWTPAELPAPEPEDFAPDEIEPKDEASGAFIFGDNLHQLRTAAIGLVVQEALTRLPAPTDYAKLSELRNFAMGVSESRWPDDPAKRDDLDTMEATERRRRAIEASRDEKIAFLVEATREQIEDFSPEANWP